MANTIAPVKHAPLVILTNQKHIKKSIATGENLDDDWIKAARHERSHSKILQQVNEAIASVHKAGVSSVDNGYKESMYTRLNSVYSY